MDERCVRVDGVLKIGFFATDFEGILFYFIFGNHTSRRNRQAIGTPKSSSATAEKWQRANKGFHLHTSGFELVSFGSYFKKNLFIFEKI
jgi:hypothetical protein